MKFKRLGRCLFMAYFLLIGCISCTNEAEQRFSCNDEIDSWTKENLSEIKKMTRIEWLNSPWIYAKSIYRAFSPEQKLNFWNDKISELKELEWSKEELTHIESFSDFINSNKSLFESGSLTDEQNDILDTFFYKWSKIAEKDLNWTPKLIRAIAGTGHKVINKQGNVQRLSNGYASPLMMKSAESNCNCKNSTLSDFCRLTGTGNCESSSCEDLERGCGWIMLQACDGRCQP